MQLHQSGEDYLETILVLKQKKGYVRSIDVATEMGFSKPSVSRAIGILKSNDFISVMPDGEIILTEKGKNAALKVYDRHIIITRFLKEILSVSDETADTDACKIEHVISVETFDKLKKLVENNR